MKICFIIPYFGKLPSWFHLFLHSCDYSSTKSLADFLVVTDDESILKMDIPSNFTVEVHDFGWMQNKIHSVFGVTISYAYKLTDFKPLYGVLFADYIRQYEYWGHCDVDMLMGDISNILVSDDFSSFDRVGEKGHMTLYRNDETINNLYKRSFQEKRILMNNFKFVVKTSYPCHFDEIGMNEICDKNNVKFLKKNYALQITIIRDWHFHTAEGGGIPQLFVFDDGHIYLLNKKSNSIEKIEYAYMHFQNRKVLPDKTTQHRKILITHEGFFDFDEGKIDEYFRTYGAPDSVCERTEFLKRLHISDRKGRISRIKQEFKTHGVFAFWNMYQRYISVKRLPAGYK